MTVEEKSDNKFSVRNTEGAYSRIFATKHLIVKVSLVPVCSRITKNDVSVIDKNGLRECAALKFLGRHPHIVAVNQITLIPSPDGATILPKPTENHSLHIAITMNRGKNVRHRRAPSLPKNKQVAEFVHQIGCALEFAHNFCIAHRDVKPDNIVLNKESRYVLIDWGLAGFAAEDKSSDTKQYVTRWYRPPELLDPSYPPSDHRAADIWSLGICVLEIFYYPNFSAYAMDTDQKQLEAALILSAQSPRRLKRRFKGMTSSIAQFLHDVFQVLPQDRLTAGDVLIHPFVFENSNYVTPIVARFPKFPSSGPSGQYSDGADELNWTTRRQLFEWLFGAFSLWWRKLSPRVIFASYVLCDRYIAAVDRSEVTLQSYRMIGCASFAVACVLYSSACPTNDDLTRLARSFNRRELESSIRHLCETLDWDLHRKTVFDVWKPLVPSGILDLTALVRLAISASCPNNYGKPLWSIASDAVLLVTSSSFPIKFKLFHRIILRKNIESLPSLESACSI